MLPSWFPPPSSGLPRSWTSSFISGSAQVRVVRMWLCSSADVRVRRNYKGGMLPLPDNSTNCDTANPYVAYIRASHTVANSVFLSLIFKTSPGGFPELDSRPAK